MYHKKNTGKTSAAYFFTRHIMYVFYKVVKYFICQIVIDNILFICFILTNTEKRGEYIIKLQEKTSYWKLDDTYRNGGTY